MTDGDRVSAASESFAAELSLDEVRVLLEAAPAGFVVPAALAVGTIESSGPDAATRRDAAMTALTGRSLLDPDVHPLLLLALGMPSGARHALQVQAWTPATSSQTLVSVAGALASIITVAVARSATETSTDVAATTTGSVSVAIGDLPLVVHRLDHLLDDAPPEPRGVRPLTVTVGLVESRSLIEAVREGDDAVVAQLAELFHAGDAVPILRGLAATAEAGIRMRSYLDRGRPFRRANFVQTATGAWVAMRVLARPGPDGSVTAQSLTDGGRVELGRFRRSSITAEIVSMVTAFELEDVRG
jgi:hypothetical protein